MSDAASPPHACAPRHSPALLLLLGAMAVVTALGSAYVAHYQASEFAYTSLLHGGFYLASLWLILRPGAAPRPRDLVLILVGAVLLRGLAMTAPPNLTTDALRYVWDGRIQWEGFNPYLWVPADPQLAYLRDAIIYPGINKKETAVTIYPPVAELLFAAAVRISDGIEGMKLVMAAAEAAVIWLLLRWLGDRGLPRERVIIYAWHPLPIWELASQAHLDAAAMAFLVAALVLADRERLAAAGAVFAAAALVKYFPVVLLPAVWRRWDWRLPAAFAATAAVLYLPYWIGAGAKVIGFLFNHLDNEGYRDGYGFHAIWILRDFKLADPPGWLYLAIALPLLAGIALYCTWRRPAGPMHIDHLLLLAGAFTLLTSPHYPWYFAWLVPLLCLRLHPGVLAMTLLAPLLHTRGDYPWESFSNAYIVVFGSYLALSAIALARRPA